MCKYERILVWTDGAFCVHLIMSEGGATKQAKDISPKNSYK